MANPKKDWVRAARASGYYPLTFNFVLVKQNKTVQCSYCGRFVHDKELTRDHVWPKSLGGFIKAPACQPCNTVKEDMKPIEFAMYATDTGLALSGNIFGDT